jgi:hypothetical protein
VCFVIAKEIDNTERLSRRAEPSTAPTTELWLATVALGDALSEYMRLTARVRPFVLRDQASR